MGVLYVAYNGALPTTASFVAVSTGTAIKTLLQISTPSTKAVKVVEWGISFDGSAAATPIECELLTTGSVAATSGTSLSGHVLPFDNQGAETTLMTMGTGNSCYSPSAEGTITATRIGDAQLVAPTGQYIKQFPLGREFHVPVSTFLRVRVKAGAAVNAICYIVWEE